MVLAPLRPYQREAIAAALARMQSGGGFGLFFEQRAGKTRTALTIVARCRPKHLWVICPKAGGAAPEVWWREIEQCRAIFPELDDIQIRVENYEQWVKRRKATYAEARKLKDLFVICDESHYIKKRGTSRSRTTRRIGRYARWRLALTGTPIAQGIQDAWAQFDFIDPSVFGPWDDQFDGMIRTHEGFDSRYLVWGGYKAVNPRTHKREPTDVVGVNNEAEFYEKFHAHCYRITLREARTAPLLIKYTRVPVDLSRASSRIYDDLEQLLVAEVNERKVKVKNILACLIKLQQVTGGTVLLDSDHYPPVPTPTNIGREKLEALHTVVRGLRSRTKFIVIARFVHEIKRIARELHRLNFTVKEVRAGHPYDGKFECDCIVMQEQAGIAVDMSQADIIIYYSMDFSMINFEQSRFRVLTYDKPHVQYYFLMATGTVDEYIYTAVTKKRNLAKLICDVYRHGRLQTVIRKDARG
jgi:hypothetical protein